MKRIALIVLGFAASMASADVLILKDGTRLQGEVKKGEQGYVVDLPDGKFKVVPLEQVKSIELQTGGQTPADMAKEKLASLRRSVEYDTDLNRIIERYQRFIEQSGATPVAEEAKQDLSAWQQRRDAGLTKYGSRWVDEKEKAALQEKALQVADAARRMIKAGKIAEAETTLNQALAEDPKNPTALYLKGLLQFQQDQIVNARKSFEAVNQIIPGHAPTLNNLAIIAAKQSQLPQSLGYYDQAMTATPKQIAILNNVAEMLNILPDEHRATPAAQKAYRRFTDQDLELQREMEKQGMLRWGATWVTKAQREELKVAERAVKDKLDQLSAEFDASKVRINSIDREIEENGRAMARLQASSYVRDVTGNIYQSVLPATYYQLQDDSRKLQRERDEEYAKLERLRQSARQVNMDFPIPKFSGVQRLIETDGAPTIGPPTQPSPATTQPAA